MLDQLVLLNLPSGSEVSIKEEGSVFILKTCQRTLLLSMNEEEFPNQAPTMLGKDAYAFLLQIICGLQSKLVGENEIVSQFKQAYKEFSATPDKCTKLLLVLEKLFKDAKEIRTKYLLGLSQKTYSSLTRKHILKFKAEKVLIIGSGQLAEDLINQFKKKCTVYISARNSERVKELASTHNIEIIKWKDYDRYSEFPYIANTIGTNKEIIFKNDFFMTWDLNNENKLFVDLGSASTIDTPMQLNDGVVRLKEIFSEGAIHEGHKLKQIEKAKNALQDIVTLRHKVLQKKAKRPVVLCQN